MQELHQEQLLLAYHDRSDGGLLATLCEMAFAGGSGLNVRLDGLGSKPSVSSQAEAVVPIPASADCVDQGPGEAAPESGPEPVLPDPIAALFSEELGAVLQVKR